MKAKLVSTPIMVAPNWSKEFKLMCDASDYAIGAVLGQQRDKIFHAIYYASKVLNDEQLNYCLLYTSDAADEGLGVDLGGRRIIKKIFFKQKTAYEM